MITMPKRNLAPESEPWGRKVDERLDQIDKTVAQNKQDTSNSQSAINSTVTKLSEQVAAIDELTQELAAQQAALEAQQAQLAVQVAQIASLVDGQIYPRTSFAEYKDFALSVVPPGGLTPRIFTTSIDVPSGYTRALVYTTISLTAYNTTGQLDFLYLGASIDNGGVGMTAYMTVEPDRTVSLSRSASSLLTNLGSTISIGANASAGNIPWTVQPTSNNVGISTMVLFLR